ncbi:hypothetical protein GCM10012280_45350 [Wenjunlia tyrosinilytica]|uniref:LysR substrate-binding domain-containing protein n=1 Tax=Wenjunlia tyrosinilytica TaxID=1544741 RepID=A0A917ZW16_9ACTN|nr:hypothetical protein GCM10012280_45350 [Wenjunlia tyrosinilytica]
MAIVRPPVDLPNGSELRVLRSEPRVACVADLHPLASRREVSVADLLDQPIVAAPGSGIDCGVENAPRVGALLGDESAQTAPLPRRTASPGTPTTPAATAPAAVTDRS